MTHAQKHREVIKVLGDYGWTPIRVKGSHQTWMSATGRPFVVPTHPEVSPFVMLQLKGVLKSDNCYVPAHWL
jgi:predicted RNA binding protein YcfA (HicA-like mRNA interferase family)